MCALACAQHVHSGHAQRWGRAIAHLRLAPALLPLAPRLAPLGAPQEDGSTALMLAAAAGQLSCVDFLLQRGTQVELAQQARRP